MKNLKLTYTLFGIFLLTVITAITCSGNETQKTTTPQIIEEEVMIEAEEIKVEAIEEPVVIEVKEEAPVEEAPVEVEAPTEVVPVEEAPVEEIEGESNGD